MLKDTRRARMNASAKTLGKATPPVLLCRLCHCEFTNFKEHVKSLVHLDARETKSTPSPPTKHKSHDRDSTVCAKKVKRDNENEQSTASKDKITETKESTSSDSKGDASVNKQMIDISSSCSEHEDDVDHNGSVISKKDDVAELEPEPKPQNEVDEMIKFARESDIPLNRRERNFLKRHWHCKLCLHVHRIEDGSFDEHAHDLEHKAPLARRLHSLRQNHKWRKDNAWIMTCSACAFQANETSQFLSHLQTESHHKNVNDIIGKLGLQSKDDTPCTTSNKETDEKTEQVPPTNLKSPTKVIPLTEQKNTTPKHSTPHTDTKKTTPSKPHLKKSHGGSSVPQNTQHNPPKSNLKPLMSLNLREKLNQNKPGWNSTSAVKRSSSPSSKPGILGAYRPEFNPNKHGFDSLSRNDRFGRSADGRDSSGMRSSGSGVGRPTYSEINRDIGTSARTFELDSYRSRIGPDSVWSPQNSLPSPTEKLNSLAFGGVGPESPSRQFDVLANLLASQRSGLLPSSVSLDLASNSSFRLKQGSDRGAMFDNYPAPRLDFSRTDFSRTQYSRNELPRMDLSRQDLSRSDHFSRPMYTRR